MIVGAWLLQRCGPTWLRLGSNTRRGSAPRLQLAAVQLPLPRAPRHPQSRHTPPRCCHRHHCCLQWSDVKPAMLLRQHAVQCRDDGVQLHPADGRPRATSGPPPRVKHACSSTAGRHGSSPVNHACNNSKYAAHLGRALRWPAPQLAPSPQSQSGCAGQPRPLCCANERPRRPGRAAGLGCSPSLRCLHAQQPANMRCRQHQTQDWCVRSSKGTAGRAAPGVVRPRAAGEAVHRWFLQASSRHLSAGCCGCRCAIDGLLQAVMRAAPGGAQVALPPGGPAQACSSSSRTGAQRVNTLRCWPGGDMSSDRETAHHQMQAPWPTPPDSPSSSSDASSSPSELEEGSSSRWPPTPSSPPSSLSAAGDKARW